MSRTENLFGFIQLKITASQIGRPKPLGNCPMSKLSPSGATSASLNLSSTVCAAPPNVGHRVPRRMGRVIAPCNGAWMRFTQAALYLLQMVCLKEVHFRYILSNGMKVHGHRTLLRHTKGGFQLCLEVKHVCVRIIGGNYRHNRKPQFTQCLRNDEFLLF